MKREWPRSIAWVPASECLPRQATPNLERAGRLPPPMISAHFGSPTEPLYGVHHRPEAPAPGTVGAVLCPPVFHEGTNSHRALRNLADQFARAGMHALRFDYRGSGDSAGGEDRFRVANCVEDILAARDELRDARGLSRVGLVGLRLGASFAALAAQRCRDLPFLVLWE